jgi:hypothetical protein
MTDAQIAGLARRQHGLVSQRQALELVSPWRLEHLVESRWLEPVRRSVYRVVGVPPTWRQLLLAACLAREGAVASFRAAAALWGLERFPEGVLEITVPGVRRARLQGVIVHESQVWGPIHVAERDGIPVTSMARTLCDLTAVARRWPVERAVDEALRKKLVTLQEIQAVHEELAGRGRRRCTTMSDILEARALSPDVGDSAPEARIIRLLVRAGLPRPVSQYVIRTSTRTYRVDLAYPEHKIAIEYDSWEFHSPRSIFDSDRDRLVELGPIGWMVLPFTSASTDHFIVSKVREALQSRASGS